MYNIDTFQSRVSGAAVDAADQPPDRAFVGVGWWKRTGYLWKNATAPAAMWEPSLGEAWKAALQAGQSSI